MKPVPKFWWDFNQPAQSPIVVQSDFANGECLAQFPFENDASAAIAQAEKLIADLVAGRKTLKEFGL
jgi:hypothetical protein